MIFNKTFYFIRHGKTDGNLSAASTEHTDIPLNHQGIQQAKNAALLFENVNLSCIISSPLLRARQTAEILSNLLNIPLMFNNNLQERSFTSSRPEYESLHTEDDKVKMETETEFADRIILTINNILKLEELPLIVSHGDVFSILIRTILHVNIWPDNCVPYLFMPPTQVTPHWVASIISE